MNEENKKLVTRANVSLDPALYYEIKQQAIKKNISVRKLIHSFLIEQIDTDEFLKLTAPKLHLIEFNQDSILIKDEKIAKTRLAVITIVDNGLWCDLDETKDCEHIHYCLRLNKINRFKNKIKQL